MKDIILVLFSGGLDSTYVLWHFLTKTDQVVHAHHVSLRIKDISRWEKEKEAVDKIVQYCKKIREFDYSETEFHYPLQNGSRDSDVTLLVASRVAATIVRNNKVTAHFGFCPDDLDYGGNRDRKDRNINSNLWKALVASVDKENINPELGRLLFAENIYKKDIINRLPEELFDMTWSCRSPKNIGGQLHECGNCLPCSQRRELRKA